MPTGLSSADCLTQRPDGSDAFGSQFTLAREAHVQGVGFVGGSLSRLVFQPAACGEGIRFVRTDLPGRPTLPARVAHVIHCDRRTTLGQNNAHVEMTEHVLAALAGLGIDNCTVQIDCGETPAMDGSSHFFVQALLGAGVTRQSQPRRPIVIDQTICVEDGLSTIQIGPHEKLGFSIEYNLEYSNPGIGRQSFKVELEPTTFVRDVAPARTFVMAEEVAALQAAGIGLKQTARDLLVFAADGSVIDNHVRYPDECARHKVLDIVGDLALVGRPIVGRVVAHRCGHRHNAALARKIVEAYGRLDVDESVGRRAA